MSDNSDSSSSLDSHAERNNKKKVKYEDWM